MIFARPAKLFKCSECGIYVTKLVGKLCNECSWKTFAFPMVRRVFPSLIADELVSVQPMTETGFVYAPWISAVEGSYKR